MTKFGTVLATLFLAALALQALGCGSSMSNSNRVLQSMTIIPVTADARNFANGQVQFTANGTFSKAPSPQQVTFQPPYSGGWSLMSTGAAATISPAGLAQCAPGAVGTATIVATATANAAMGTGATGVAVRATATLTCP